MNFRTNNEYENIVYQKTTILTRTQGIKPYTSQPGDW